MAGIESFDRRKRTEPVEEIAKLLQALIDGSQFELEVSRRRETTLMRRGPKQRTMSTGMDTRTLGRVASSELKKTYEQGTWRSGEWGERLRIRPVYRDGLGERSTSELRAVLQEFTDSDGGHVGHALLDSVEGASCTYFPGSGFGSEDKVSTLEEFRDYLTVAAAILGTDRAAGHLGAWVGGEPLQYRGMALLVGVRLDEPLTLEPGIRVERLSTKSGSLPESLPGYGSTAPETYLGGVVLSIPCEAAPALFKPRKRSDGGWDYRHDVRHSWVLDGSSLDEFCESLSLAYDECVRCKEIWRDYGELREYSELSSRGRKPETIVEDKLPGAFLTQLQLENAWEFHRQRVGRKWKDGVGTAIGRWVSSKRPEATLPDRFIDLRIALEALYLDGDSGGEKAYRLASRGAWHAGGEIETRRINFDALRKAYNVSSIAIHAGTVKDNQAHRDLLDRAQSLCRAGVVKRLAEDAKPDWTNLILGG